MYSLLVGLGISVIFKFINEIVSKTKIKLLVNILVSLGIISLLIYTSIPERIINPYHEHHQMDADIMNACKTVPENSYLLYRDDAYNTMYFHCFPYLRNRIMYNPFVSDEILSGIMKRDYRLFVAYKEKLREDYDEWFDIFSKKYNLSLYHESLNVNLYEVKS